MLKKIFQLEPMFIEANTVPVNNNVVTVDGTHFVAQQQNYLSQYTSNPFWPHYEYANQWPNSCGLPSSATNGSYLMYDNSQAITQQQQTDYTGGCPVIMRPNDLSGGPDVFVDEQQHVVDLPQFGTSSYLYNQYVSLSSSDRNS